MATEYEGVTTHLMVALAALRRVGENLPNSATPYVRLRASLSAQNVQEAIRTITDGDDGK
jgi:hypothetical protein